MLNIIKQMIEDNPLKSHIIIDGIQVSYDYIRLLATFPELQLWTLWIFLYDEKLNKYSTRIKSKKRLVNK